MISLNLLIDTVEVFALEMDTQNPIHSEFMHATLSLISHEQTKEYCRVSDENKKKLETGGEELRYVPRIPHIPIS